MDVKSLQIGDYVNYRGQIIKVTSLYDKGDSNEVGWSDKERVWVNADNVKPIQLKKLHLAKNGFEPTDETDREFVFCDGYNIKVLFDEGCEIYEQDGKTLFDKIPPSTLLTINFAEKDIWMPIEYVHELQHAMRIMGCDKTIEL